jgi:hypothetical protein
MRPFIEWSPTEGVNISNGRWYCHAINFGVYCSKYTQIVESSHYVPKEVDNQIGSSSS